MALQGKKVLNVNSQNQEIVTQKIMAAFDNKNTVKGTIKKVEYRQLLGEKAVYIYYTDYPKEEIIFGDTQGSSIIDYINQNGYDQGQIGKRRLLISVVIILISICCGIIEFVREKASIKVEQEKIKVQVEKESNELEKFIKYLDKE